MIHNAHDLEHEWVYSEFTMEETHEQRNNSNLNKETFKILRFWIILNKKKEI